MMRSLDMAGRDGRRREYPVPNADGQIPRSVPAPFENGRELTGDGKLQGHAGLGFLDAEGECIHVDPLPAQGQHPLPEAGLSGDSLLLGMKRFSPCF